MFTNFGPKYNLNTNFLLTSDKKIRWYTFVNSVNKYIKALHDKGIRKNDFVAIDLENSVEYIYSVFALWYIEATPVLLNVRLMDKEKIELMEFTNCKFLISIKKITNEINHISPNELELKKIKYRNKKLDLSRTAIIIFTSGSTGKPKGVMLTFSNLIANNKSSDELLKYSRLNSWIASLPFFHIGGFSIITRSYLSNLKLIISDSLSTNDLQKAFEKYKPSFASFVSTQLINFNVKNFEPKKFKKLLLGGGFIRNNLITKGNKLGWNIFKVYGASETTAFVTALDTIKYKHKLSSAGKPLKNFTVDIVKETNKNEGEIIIKGHSVFKGYFNNEEETRKKLKKDFYYTGDFGYKDDDGFIYVLARRMDLIISGGENINPFEIEEVLSRNKNIAEAYVIGIEDEKWGQVPAAVVKFKDKKYSLDELNDYLKEYLPSFKLLKKMKEVSDFPKTSLHKIKREELKKLF
ncbi:MAG TPA: o-succinylbenzoate--CoA ligase [Ignavibacteriaceae bacterium]|nr:o-succinylbenzoate--CoA ligase [Ignavibacteriaceae bacterium]